MALASRRWTVVVVVVLAAVMIVGSVLMGVGPRGGGEAGRVQALARHLAPDAELESQSAEDLNARAEALAKRYPRDPRTRWWNGRRLAASGTDAAAAAEAELRAALAEPEMLALFDKNLEIQIRVTLVRLLLAGGKKDAALAAAAPVCAAGPGGMLPEPLEELQVCPGAKPHQH